MVQPNGLTTVSDLNELFNLIYEDSLYVARESNIMTGLVTNYSASGWMTRKLTWRPQLTAKEKPEGQDFTDVQKWDKTAGAQFVPATVMAGVLITDEEIETDPEDTKRSAAQELGNAMAAKIDRDIAGDFKLLTRDKGPGAGTAATLTKFATCISVLRASSIANPIRIVCHPYHWFDVWKELGQPAATQALLGDLANQALKDFFVGNFLSVNWFTSSNIEVDANDDAVSAVFNPGALAFDSRKPPTPEQERDITRLAWEYVISAGYAHGLRRDDSGVKYTADATEPA
jgi:hypothetical protein